ncbi:MAG: flagellar hook protein FlgE [Pseudomonadota bacterium]
MSFFTALSGLNAAQTDISVTSNNIANVSTMGFQSSRASFADIFFSNPQAAPSKQIGAGVRVQQMTVDFNQGTTVATGNIFDFALGGQGFFMVRTGPDAGADMGYTRAGAFGMNGEGFVVNPAGHFLNVFPTSPGGQTLSTAATERLQVPQTFGQPQATQNIALGVQMSLGTNGGQGTQTTVPAAAFDPANADTFAFSTDVPMLDADGNAIAGQVYFVLDTAPTAANPAISYSVQFVRDGEVLAPPAPAGLLSFDAAGLQTGPAGPQAFTDAAGLTYSLDLAGSNVSQDSFEVVAVTQDGQSSINLSSIDITDDGVIFANYGAANTVALGQVALATFPNLQGLNPIGDATYLSSDDAGPIRLGAPLDTGFGALQSGALEQSNVDLTAELVNLITAQRNYQASARALETNGAITDTVLNIRN